MKYKTGALLALLPALLAGCSSPATAVLPYAREIQRTALMEALAVDLLPGGTGVAVTASSGARAGTGESPGEAPLVLQGTAETVAAACGQMQTYGADNVFYGDVEQVLAGEALARDGLDDLLAHMARDPELRLEAQLWVVLDGDGEEALSATARDGGAAARLSALEDDGELLGAPAAKTAREAMAELLLNGCTLLPALAVEEAGEERGLQGEQTLSQAGYALFREGRLAGRAQGPSAEGMDLLEGRGEGRMLEFSAPDGRKAALRLTQVRTWLRPVFDGEALQGLSVRCQVQAEAAEFQGGGLDEGLRTWLEEQLARESLESLSSAIELCQDLSCDCLHLGRKAALSAPWRKAALQKQWEAAFPGLEIELDVQAAVARV